jgi:LAGLIDADG endonuclease
MEDFPHTIPVPRPLVDIKTIPNPNWIAGFASAESCFHVSIPPKGSRKGIQIVFSISQHIQSFIKYFDCGHFGIYSVKEARFRVTKFWDISETIIPFLKKILSSELDFLDFCRVAELIKAKQHLNEEVRNKILEIKKGINRGRDWLKSKKLKLY